MRSTTVATALATPTKFAPFCANTLKSTPSFPSMEPAHAGGAAASTTAASEPIVTGVPPCVLTTTPAMSLALCA